jgi:hypothetical protein
MRASFSIPLLSLAMIVTSAPAHAQSAAAPPLQYAKQGWTADERQAFYTTTQGSHMMPWLWFKALRRLDADEPFGGDQLQRYGYLPNGKSRQNPEGLPVGFVIDGDTSTGYFGMTCAACHTAEIEYQKDGATQQLRIDGAPATANFQLFLTELTVASRATLNDADRFRNFAHAVLGSRYSTTRTNRLKSDFAAWVKQFGDFMDKSLPPSPWGPARLDAFGMIFNRVAGKDLNIPDNIKAADAPVSYPFLWNASRQDRTQWNGGVPNGLYINAIGRNTGEVFGVFADFAPRKQLLPPHYNFRNNSVNFTNLQLLEEKIAALRPPPWPFPVDSNLADKGRVLFAEHCGSCHEEKRLPEGTWLTPVAAVGTDSKMFDNSLRKSQTGLLKGALSLNPPGSKLGDEAFTNNVLATSVVGALAGDAFPQLPRLPNLNGGVWLAIKKDLAILFSDTEKAPNLLSLLEPSVRENVRSHVESRLANMFVPPNPDAPAAYESRVLHGIWATAPYLHNGSVPNLWELLLPPERRSASFMVGSRKFDAEKVGYVTTESPYKDGTLVVGTGAAPGNSNAGHDYGKDLDDDQRKALLEYLKQL